MSPLERFRDRAAAHAASLPAEEAIAWIAGHGLLSLAAYPALRREVAAEVDGQMRRNLAGNLLRIDGFRRAADGLGGLPAAPLKGIYLLDTVYRDDPGSRPMSDLDLLVRSRDVEEAVGRLAAAGFAETAASRRTGAGWHERCLAGRGVLLELHTRLGIKHAPRSSWAELAPVPARVHGREVHALDAETTLVHLVAHFVKHGPFLRLGWVEDVLRWAERGVDGARATAIARRLGALRSLVAGTRALRRAAGADLLPGVPDRLGGPAGAAVALCERAVWRRAAERPFAPPPLGKLRRNAAALLLADGPADALGFVAAKARELTLRRATPGAVDRGP